MCDWVIFLWPPGSSRFAEAATGEAEEDLAATRGPPAREARWQEATSLSEGLGRLGVGFGKG